MIINSISANAGNFQIQAPKNEPDQNLFDRMLGTIEQMNDKQIEANLEIGKVLRGESDNTHGVLIQLEKVELQMQLATTVRDKLVAGYQQIINMQL